MRRATLFIATLATLALSGCAGPAEQDDCAYGGCADYSPDIDINGWDIFGPFVLGFLAIAFIGAIITIAIKAGENTDDEAPQHQEDEPERP